MRITCLPERKRLGVVMADFIVHQAFEGAVASFTQRTINVYRHLMQVSDGLRGIARSLQIARINRCRRLTLQRTRQ